MNLFSRLSYRNKLLIYMMAMVIFVAGTMGFLIRFVILPHFIREMEKNAEYTADRLSHNVRGHILNRDSLQLTAALFDAKQFEKNIAYIIASDAENRLLAHTFIGRAPENVMAEQRGTDAASGISLSGSPIRAGREFSDIIVLVYEGLYQIGAIRIGIDNRPINSAIRDMNLFHLGFTCFITGVSLFFCFYLSGVITRPITFLTQLAGQISFGKLNTCISVGTRMGRWEIEPCNGDGPVTAIMTRQGGGAAPGASSSKMNDEIVLLAGAFNNMTRRLRVSEEELRLSEQNYRLLFNSNPNPVFVVARDTGRLLDANDRASEIYGHSKETFLGMRFTDLGLPEDASLFADALDCLDDSTRPRSLSQRVRHRSRTGHSFWINVHFSRYEHLGRPAVIATPTDISDIIDVETKLIQAGKMATLGEMSAGIAHELNQPLNAMKVGSEFLLTMTDQKKPVNPDQLQEVASAISTEVDRASSIINHLREFGRKTTISKERVDINKPIRGVFTIIGQQLKVHGIDVVTDLDERLPMILSDENRIEQVLVNLINNASDAIQTRRELSGLDHPGLLRIRSCTEGDRVVVTVSDNGTGIPVEKRGRIFEPFFTTKAVGKGTGLGLSISYGIVRDYDGEIEFETEEGVGTTFKVSFPAA